MKFVTTLTPRDQQIAALRLSGFLPDEVYDIHAHPSNAEHFAAGTRASPIEHPLRGCREHRAALPHRLPVPTIHGLFFGMPQKTADRPAINAWVESEVRQHRTPPSRALLLAPPADDRESLAANIEPRWDKGY